MFLYISVQYNSADDAREASLTFSQQTCKEGASLKALQNFVIHSEYFLETIISTVVQLLYRQEAFHLIYMVIEIKYPLVCNRLYLTDSSSDGFCTTEGFWVNLPRF